MPEAASSPPFVGLVAAPHTPFDQAGALALDGVERQIEHLLADGVTSAYVSGATGEGLALSFDERRQLFERWGTLSGGQAMRLIAHVGAAHRGEAVELAGVAERVGAEAIAAVAPSFHRPGDVDTFVAWLAPIAAAAPDLPFYVYDIPALTGVTLPTDQLLARGAEVIPNLRGVKYTRTELDLLQRCLTLDGGRFDVLWGCDEALLAALALGVRGAVGSSYNFAAPLYHRLLAAFEAGDLERARTEQRCSVQLIDLLASYGYLAASKEVMELLGVPCGPPRAPTAPLGDAAKQALREDLDRIGFKGPWRRS